MYTYLSRVCREQWIRAKYERKEFTKEAADGKDRAYVLGKESEERKRDMGGKERVTKKEGEAWVEKRKSQRETEKGREGKMEGGGREGVREDK